MAAFSASLMCADLGHLAAEVTNLERAGIDSLHLDVMDGHFVPNITFGADTAAAIRPRTGLPLHVHAMVEDPVSLVEPMAHAGCDALFFHLEACRYPRRLMKRIEAAGMVPGVALNPGTPAAAVEYVLPIPLVLVMAGVRDLAAPAPRPCHRARARHGPSRVHQHDAGHREPRGQRGMTVPPFSASLAPRHDPLVAAADALAAIPRGSVAERGERSASVSAFAADVGGTKVHATLAALDGSVLVDTVEATDRSPGGLPRELAALHARLRALSPEAGPTLTGWVGIPATYDANGDLAYNAANLVDLETYAPRLVFADALGVPVTVAQDTRLAAVGECWRGTAQGCDDYAVLCVGTGVSMGIVMHGALYAGGQGAAGEIAYLPLGPDPFAEGHRRTGSFEDAASGPALAHRYAAAQGRRTIAARSVRTRARCSRPPPRAIAMRAARSSRRPDSSPSRSPRSAPSSIRCSSRLAGASGRSRRSWRRSAVTSRGSWRARPASSVYAMPLPQMFVNRCYVAAVSGISKDQPKLEGLFVQPATNSTRTSCRSRRRRRAAVSSGSRRPTQGRSGRERGSPADGECASVAGRSER